MKRTLLATATVALGLGALLLAPAASAATSPDSLRALADQLGIKVGSAIDPALLESNPEYAAIAADQFSTVTAENAMKWDHMVPTRGEYDWSKADALVDFAEANGQEVRGHTLVWHYLPAWLTEAAPSMTAEEVRDLLRQHITDVMARYKGKIWQWDVANEVFEEDGTLRDTIWLQKLGPGYIADAYRWAHEADPDALLFYNDYNIEFSGPKSQAVYDLIAQLKYEGVPIDGVGFQAHLSTQDAFPDLQANMQRVADLGLKVAVTEIDIRGPQPMTPETRAKQADYYTQALEACLAIENCISYTAWGFTDAHSWVPSTIPGMGDATIYDDELRPKPQYLALQETLREAVAALPSSMPTPTPAPTDRPKPTSIPTPPSAPSSGVVSGLPIVAG